MSSKSRIVARPHSRRSPLVGAALSLAAEGARAGGRRADHGAGSGDGADLRQQVESALLGKACRLVRIASEYQRRDEEQAPLLGLDQLNPQELFSREGLKMPVASTPIWLPPIALAILPLFRP